MNGGTCAVSDRVASSHHRGIWRRRALADRLRLPTLSLALLLIPSLAACGLIADSDSDSRLTFRLVTGTENRSLTPIIERFADREDVEFELTHQGSVDTMLELEQ